LKRLAPELKGEILDFGCGSMPYRDLLSNATSYIGLEYDTLENRINKRADIFYDGERIPLEDNSIDGALSTQTLEHVPNPERIVQEWFRVIKCGGKLLLTVPFMWPEHEMPYDFQRYTTQGLYSLLEKNGFVVLFQERLLADCRVPAQLFLTWLYDSLRFGERSMIMRLLLIALLFTPVSLTATGLASVCPNNTNTYMDNIILMEKV
jgi:SAM-dependent methyltransferase